MIQAASTTAAQYGSSCQQYGTSCQYMYEHSCQYELPVRELPERYELPEQYELPCGSRRRAKRSTAP